MERSPDWAVASWEGASRESARAGLRMSMTERLAWLEEMGRLYERIHGARGGRPPAESAPRRGEQER